MNPTSDSSQNDELRAEVMARLCLMSLIGLGPTRARWLTGGGPAAPAVAALRSGRLPDDLERAPAGVRRDTVDQWADALRALNPEELLERHHGLGIEILAPGDPRWPFGEDPEPPMLLFYRGDLDLLQMPNALAIVGTRRCTSVGRTVAYEMGAEVAAAGVAIVSGLALGIDGAAHRGALDRAGAVIGVVGSGLDVVYPGANRSLWNEVGDRGLLVSEASAGARPERWRFPARNRLIAGLSSALLVVESHGRGGALLTVDEAVDRGLPVLAVPGSVLSPASDGTNELLVEGAIPVRNSADVLGNLGFGVGAGLEDGGDDEAGDEEVGALFDHDADGGLNQLASAILFEITTGPVHIDQLIEATGSSASEMLAEVQSLVSSGRVLLDGSTVCLP